MVTTTTSPSKMQTKSSRQVSSPRYAFVPNIVNNPTGEFSTSHTNGLPHTDSRSGGGAQPRVDRQRYKPHTDSHAQIPDPGTPACPLYTLCSHAAKRVRLLSPACRSQRRRPDSRPHQRYAWCDFHADGPGLALRLRGRRVRICERWGRRAGLLPRLH